MARRVEALITPEVLKWARERRVNLSIERAAEKLKISTERLESWEYGTVQTQLRKIKEISPSSIEPTSLFSTCRIRPQIFNRLRIIGYCQNRLRVTKIRRIG